MRLASSAPSIWPRDCSSSAREHPRGGMIHSPTILYIGQQSISPVVYAYENRTAIAGLGADALRADRGELPQPGRGPKAHPTTENCRCTHEPSTLQSSSALIDHRSTRIKPYEHHVHRPVVVSPQQVCLAVAVVVPDRDDLPARLGSEQIELAAVMTVRSSASRTLPVTLLRQTMSDLRSPSRSDTATICHAVFGSW